MNGLETDSDPGLDQLQDLGPTAGQAAFTVECGQNQFGGCRHISLTCGSFSLMEQLNFLLLQRVSALLTMPLTMENHGLGLRGCHQGNCRRHHHEQFETALPLIDGNPNANSTPANQGQSIVSNVPESDRLVSKRSPFDWAALAS